MSPLLIISVFISMYLCSFITNHECQNQQPIAAIVVKCLYSFINVKETATCIECKGTEPSSFLLLPSHVRRLLMYTSPWKRSLQRLQQIIVMSGTL